MKLLFTFGKHSEKQNPCCLILIHTWRRDTHLYVYVLGSVCVKIPSHMCTSVPAFIGVEGSGVSRQTGGETESSIGQNGHIHSLCLFFFIF